MRLEVFFGILVFLAPIHILVFLFETPDRDRLPTMTNSDSNTGSGGGPLSTPQPNPNPKPKPPKPSKPRDGPAVIFEADPIVADIFTGADGDYFGLVLVSNWPVEPLVEMDGPYQKFLDAVRACFREEDLAPSNQNPASLPAVYLYPTRYLHVTLATFFRPAKISENRDLSDDARRAEKKEGALELVRKASKLSGWPTEPLRLTVDAAQIGTKAGILLWKDLSGGVAAIRNCLREALADTSGGAADATNAVEATTSIPGIVHSTFLRFAEVAQTPGEDVQEAFRSRGLGTPSKEFFCTSSNISDGDGDRPCTNAPLVLRAKTVRLVSESIPYMHLPNDDEHVPWTTELTTARSSFSTKRTTHQ